MKKIHSLLILLVACLSCLTARATNFYAETNTPDIQALARGLENDPVRIFNYVHDHIQYLHYFGSIKGAEMTLLEKSGNDFDQCALLFALLKSAGYTNIGYQFGWTMVPYKANDGNDLYHWLGLTRGSSDWPSTTNYLNTFFEVYRDYPANGGLSIGPGTNTVIFQRIWVTLTNGGITYYLDPSFKVSQPIVGTNLVAAMQFNSTNLLSNAAGFDGGYYVSNLNETAISNTLTGYTTNLLNFLQANCPNASVQDILGGQYIVPSTNTTLSQTLPFATTNLNGTMAVTNWASQPTNLLSTISISFAGTNYQCFVPLLLGKRLSLVYSNTGLAQLWLDDSELVEKTTSGTIDSVTISFAHPDFGSWNTTNNTYISSPHSRNEADETKSANYQRTNASYTLIYSFNPDWGWLQQRQDKLSTYLQQTNNSSRQVVTETLNTIGLGWMLQSFQTERLLATQIGILPFHFHMLGRMAQEASRGYYVDVYMNKPGAIPSDAQGDPQNIFYSTYAFFGSALEHGIIEQLQSSNLVAASTVKMLEIANSLGQKIFLATNNNWSGGVNVQSQLINYDTTTKGDIGQYVTTDQYPVLVPQNGSNHVAGAASWSGYGYAALATGAIHMFINGGYHGGYVSDYGASVDTSFVDYSDFSQADYFDPSPLFTPDISSADPVCMVDGTFQVSATDLSLGQAEPRGINLSRYYNGTRRLSNPAAMASGWVNSYYFNAATTAAPQAGLGFTTPAQMAPMLVATCAAIKTFNDIQPNAKNWTVTALISKWAVDQLTKNGASIILGKDTVQFVKQPNGVFTPPAGCTMTLTQAVNSAYTLQERHGNTFKFDPLGHLTNIVDQYNQSMTFSYNANGFVTNATDWKGRKLSFTYSGSPLRLTSVADSTGRSVGYAYVSNAGQLDLASVTDPEGKTCSYYYDTNHNILACSNALNQLVVSNIFDSAGRVATQYTQGDVNKTWQIFWSGWQTVSQDPAGGKQRYFYDDLSRLIGQRDALSNLTQTVYDGQNHQVMTISPLNETNQYVYDGNNNLVSIIDPLGFTSRFIYDNQNNVVHSVDARGNTNNFGYNASFSLIGSTNGANEWVTNAYNADGTLHSRTDSGGATTYGYDGYGQLNSIVYPGGLGSESFSNSVVGDVLTHINARTNSTSFSYNLRRQLTNTVAPTNLTTSITYDAAGNVLLTTDARSKTTTNTWSATGHLLATSLPATLQGVPVTTNVYDVRDWLVKTIDPLQNTNLFTNDAAQRLISVTDPVLRTTRTSYDADNRPTGITNAALEKIIKQWDARGKIALLTDNSGHTIGYTNDQAGNQVALTNRNGKVWKFQYDGANRLTKTVSPLARNFLLSFNNRGLLVTNTEPSTLTQVFSYDPLGRMTNRSDSIGNTAYGYDADGNTTNVSEGANKCVWTYDACDHVSSYQDIYGNLIQYRYDENGNLTNLIYPGNKTVLYVYDSLNRLTNVTDWSNRKTTFAYDLASRLTSITRPNGTVRTLGHDAAGQTTNILEKTAGGSIISLFRFQWNNAARADWEFAAPIPHPVTIPSRSMTFDDDNRLISLNGNSLSPDADGNMTNGPLNSGTLVTYAYDARNRLLNVGGVTNAYDPTGSRVGFTYGTDSVAYVVNPNAKFSQVLMRVKNGTTNYYVYGLGLLYQITETTTGTNTLTYHSDYHGSTVAVTDDGGNVTDRIEYSPYGTTTYRSGSIDTPFLFNGHHGVQTDPNGLLYMRARYYNPYVCRFINPDPSGFTGGLNWYAYADGNPVSYMDPYGLGAINDAVNEALGNNSDYGWMVGAGVVAAAVLAPEFLLGDLALEGAGVEAFDAGAEVFDAGAASREAEQLEFDFVNDDLSGQLPADEGQVLYRGVWDDHPAFNEALEGNADPRGGTATPEEHNSGNTESIYTSWTTDPALASERASSGGVVLRQWFPINRLVPSPDVYGEGEVLVTGPVRGANVTRVP